MSHTYNELETKDQQNLQTLDNNTSSGTTTRRSSRQHEERSNVQKSLQVLKNLKHLNQAFGTCNVVVVDIDRGEIPQPIGCSARSCCSPTLIGTRVTFS